MQVDELKEIRITPFMKIPINVMISYWMISKIELIICAIYGSIIAKKKKYMNEILEPKLKPSICDLFQDKYVFLFQQNSVPCHVATVEKTVFQIIVSHNWNGLEIVKALTQIKFYEGN